MNVNTVNTNKKNSITLFLIWPFFALWFALRNYRSIWAKDIIWFFVIFHGLTLTVHNVGEESNDANRYRNKFTDMAAQEISLENITSLFYDVESQQLDIVEPLLIFAVSRLTDNYHILFGVFGLFFGFFYSRNIWFLLDRGGSVLKKGNLPVILTFAFIIGYWQISGFRFWTAAHVFVYGMLQYLIDGNKKKIGFIFLAAFIHFSFIAPVAIAAIYVALGNRTKPYFILFAITFFITELNVTQVGEILSANLPEVFLPRVASYTSEAYIEKLSDTSTNLNWYVKIYNEALKWSVVSFLVFIYFSMQKFMSKYKGLDSLFCFTLLFYSFANLFSQVPSGGRFLNITNMFGIACIFFLLQFASRGKGLRRLVTLATPALVLFCIVSIRVGLDTMGFFSVFGNPILSLLIDVDITLIELVKSFFGVKSA
jgi:hypothetical protein